VVGKDMEKAELFNREKKNEERNINPGGGARRLHYGTHDPGNCGKDHLLGNSRKAVHIGRRSTDLQWRIIPRLRISIKHQSSKSGSEGDI
jgi:hypothetical protein